MNICIKNLPLYWRIKSNLVQHPLIPSVHDFELTFDSDINVFKQNVPSSLKSILNTIYKQNSNIGYIQNSPIGDLKYAHQFEILLKDYLKSSDVLEIGNGSHYFAEKFKSLYKSYTSIDPSTDDISLAKNHQHLSAFYPGSVDFGKNFDLIFHYNFLEHIEDCVGVLKSNFNHLKNSGYLIFAVPDNTESVDCGDIGFCMHEHVYYFTKESIIEILNISGFNDIKIIKSVYGGSLLVVARKNKRNFIYRKTSNTNCDDFYEKFTNRIQKFKNIDLSEYMHYVPLRAFPYLAFTNQHINSFKYVDDKISIRGMYYDGCNSRINSLDDISSSTNKYLVYSLTFGEKIKDNIRSKNPNSNIILISDIK